MPVAMTPSNFGRALGKPTRAQTIANNKADRRIDAAYRKHCCNIQINVLDIGKVFACGHKLIEQGADDVALAAGILAFVQTIAK